jgi:hypothetical protein
MTGKDQSSGNPGEVAGRDRFPPETTLRLCRKAMVESLTKLGEARAIGAEQAEVATLQAIDRVIAHAADVIINIDYQLILLARRHSA